MMIRNLLLIAGIGLAAGCASQSRVLERDVGDFDLKLGTQPTRSMAHGLVRPTTVGTVHGGLDLTHDSGWYVGQWAPSVGVLHDSQLEMNSYLGYAQHPFDDSPGYELGLIRYSFPEINEWDRLEYYAGMTFLDARLGGALNRATDRTDSTLFLDFGSFVPFGVDLRIKYASHTLDNPLYYPGGSMRIFSDWSLNLSRPWLGMQFDLSYTDSNLHGDECSVYSGQNAQCEGLVMFRAESRLF